MTSAPSAPSPRWRTALIPLAFGILALALQPLHNYLTYTVEIDFPRYASHAQSLDQVFRWDPFAPFAYPFLLWSLSKLGISIFLAGKILAGAMAVIFLALVYLLAREFLPPRLSLLAQIICAVNWHFAQSGILCGSDLPWATIQLAAFILLFRALKQTRPGPAFLAGIAAGLAFDFRYQALIALPWMALFLAVAWLRIGSRRQALLGVATLVVGFFLAASPQLAVNLSQQHSLFATGHAMNVWMGIYGQGNWTQNWQEAKQHTDLVGIIQENPARFFTHWVKESAVFTMRLPLLALGIQPALITLEPGPKLRIFFFAILGLAGLTALGGLSWKSRRLSLAGLPSAPALFLFGYVALYGAAISMAWTSFRFLLPLTPIVTLAMIQLLNRFQPGPSWRKLLTPSALVLAMAFLSAWGFYVTLERFQCRVKEIAAAVARHQSGKEVRIVSNRAALFAYHLPYQWVSLPIEIQTPEQLKPFAFSRNIAYLLFEEAHTRSREDENWPELKKWAFEQKPLYLRDNYPSLVLDDVSEQ